LNTDKLIIADRIDIDSRIAQFICGLRFLLLSLSKYPVTHPCKRIECGTSRSRYLKTTYLKTTYLKTTYLKTTIGCEL